MKKFIVIAFMALAVTMIATVPAKASDVTPTAIPTPAPRVSSLVPPGNGSGGRISVGTIFDYYNNVLTSNQKQIADYLIGMYNYSYISARGFSYNNISVTADLINRLRSFGNRFWNTTLDGNASRLDSYMQQFMSAVISYAGTIDTDFNTWVNSTTGSNLVIPFTRDSLNSWTNYYNDPTSQGVANWGEYIADWESGTYYDFALDGYWYSDNERNTYNQWVLNNSPFIFTSTFPSYNGYLTYQYMISLKNNYIIDSLYIERDPNNMYRKFRFICNQYPGGRIYYNNIDVYMNNDEHYMGVENNSQIIIDQKVFESGQTFNLPDIINYAFYRTPFWEIGNSWYSFYPYIEHVYLVDDINTLSNPEEIINVENMDINSANAIWINEPTDDDLYWQIEPTLIQGDEWNDNLVHVDLTPIDEGDLTKNIVNNTVINNYNIVAPGSVINVPNKWLESDGNYLDYTNTTALPFFVMIGDIFNALGEIRVFIIAVLILGLAGGVLVKFLL